MGQITKEFAENIITRAETGRHSPLTVHEESQLAYAWLALHGHATWEGMPKPTYVRLQDIRVQFAKALDGKNYVQLMLGDKVIVHEITLLKPSPTDSPLPESK